MDQSASLIRWYSISLSVLLTHIVRYTSGRSSYSPLCYFEMMVIAFNMELFRNSTLGSNWIDLKCSSQYVLTSLPLLTKRTLTEGLVQANVSNHLIYYYSNLRTCLPDLPMPTFTHPRVSVTKE